MEPVEEVKVIPTTIAQTEQIIQQDVSSLSTTQYFDKDEFTITVSVTDPIVRKDQLSQYVAYTIKGEDKLGQFDVLRRFSDFDALRRILQQRWPSCYIPPIPEKKALGGTDQAFIEERRNILEGFAKKTAELKHLWYSEEFQILIRSTSQEVEKSLLKLPAQSPQDLVQKYSQQFMHLSGKEINPAVEGKIETFFQYLKRVGTLLENYQDFIKKTMTMKESCNKQQELLISYLLPEYEKYCLTEYLSGPTDGKLIFSATTDQKLAQLASHIKDFLNKDDLLQLFQLVRLEIREISAFIDCLESRKSYRDQKENMVKKHRELVCEQGKIISGKSSLKSMFSKKTKEESSQEIKVQIDAIQEDIARVTEIYDIMTVLVGYVEIDRFKAEKEGLYFTTIKQLAKNEIQFSKLKQEYWQYILDNHNVSSF